MVIIVPQELHKFVFLMEKCGNFVLKAIHALHFVDISYLHLYEDYGNRPKEESLRYRITPV